MNIQPSDLNTYYSARKCQKCGYATTSDVFVPADERNPRGFFEERYTIPTINRMCRRCGFWWVENPLDVKRGEI